MLHYEISVSLEADIRRFEQDLAEFQAGRLHETAFTAKRVKMGVYLERNYTTYMFRIRCAGGILSPQQLAAAGELSRQYGDSRVHVTTRAEIQLHGVQEENLVLVLLRLREAGLSCLGGGGNTIRNIVANPDSGISPQDIFDVQPCAVALTTRMVAEPDSWELPRKIKTAFTSRSDDAAFALVQDIGFIACLNAAGERGYQLYAGGGLGARPKVGILLQEFLPEPQVYHAVRAIKNLFHAHGNRKNKHRNRIKFLIHDEMGETAFCAAYQEEFAQVLAQGSPNLQITSIDNAANLNCAIALEPLVEPAPGFAMWKERHVTKQKQEGLYAVRLPLLLGDLSPEDCQRLTNFLQLFGENTLRCGTDQNLYLRNIPERFLPNLLHVIAACTTLSDNPVIYGSLVPCTGAQTCQVGINRPRPAAQAVFRALDRADFPLPDDVQIRISGCPNSCANHWIGDIAFHGKVRHVQGRALPTYNVLGNGGISQGQLRLGEVVGWVHSFDLPRFVVEVLKMYANFKVADPAYNFSSWWNSSGKAMVADLCAATYNSIPSFEEDKNYYFDHGAEQLFSVKDMGRAECSAGMYDMIDVDDREIKKQLKSLTNGQAVPADVLHDILFRSARMLLVTRGEEPKNEADTFSLFARHFLDTGLVSAEHRFIVDLAFSGKTDELLSHPNKIIALGREMTELYEKMDSTMRFPGESGNPVAGTIQQSVTSADKIKADKFKDLSGIKCPLNFARTKVLLSCINPGETLEIILDDGEPIENVPGSVRLEGHRILRQEKSGGQWNVLIEKV
ncbi:MAG: sulfite reductase (ferredoxin) [Candidatus Electronema aureum]|uniref:Sulfite reductase (Ferredoxin) n=1 Tax=Candidatus Electronema aureum TaxID=2005002 RepID=A0A521G5I6_9BACT|nr:MAG: sulfite reductase (ferredoxin) [Candidatus Electronema aureum]